MKRQLSLAAMAALGLGAVPAAHADVNISGFGQVVAGTTLDDGSSLFGYDDEVDFRPESLFAVQVRADLNEQFSATAQIVARGNEDFDPEFAWAYIGWRPNDAISVKLGRQRTPFYRYSDYLEVGYAYPWLRPPEAVYNLGGFANYEGINAAWNVSAGSWESTAQFVYGSLDTETTISGATADAGYDQFIGATFETVHDGWLTLRVGYFTADVLLAPEALAPLFAGLRASGLGAVADKLEVNGDKGSFLGVGFEVDRSNVVVIGEYVRVEVEDSFIAERKEWYLTAGYRFGTVLPTYTYGERNNDSDTSVLALVPPQAPIFATVAGVALLDQLDATYNSIGVRWDFAKNVAFKADYTRYESSAPAGDSEADVLAAGLVFTF
jgi:hypothetical protein